MATLQAHMQCKLYPSAFSGEVVFQVHTTAGDIYEGVAPKDYASPRKKLPKTGAAGQVLVRVLSNGGAKARISAPDGQILTVAAAKIRET
jgi:hypothetical protein